MKRIVLSLTAVAVLALSLVFVAACGGDDNTGGMGGMIGSSTTPGGMMGGSGGMMTGAQPAGSIKVDLVNWAVEPAQSEAKAGSVTFWAVHDMGHQHMSDEGGITHDLQVMKKNADGSFQLVGQVQGLTMGQAKALTLDLTPGDYELSCNVVEQINGKTISHYQKGMHTPFKVV